MVVVDFVAGRWAQQAAVTQGFVGVLMVVGGWLTIHHVYGATNRRKAAGEAAVAWVAGLVGVGLGAGPL